MKRFFDPYQNRYFGITAVTCALLFFVLGVFFAHHVAMAAEPTPLAAVAAGGGLATVSLPIFLARIIRAVLGVLGIITVIIVIYAGYLYMTAGGDSTKIKTAKKLLINTVIGLFIIFSSYSIASWILNALTKAVNGPGSITSIAKKYIEPLSGSLGAGIIESYYPMRGASGIARNTKIFVTFKEPIKPDTIIDGYKTPCTYSVDAQNQTPCSTNLNTDAVSIFETAKGESTKLSKTSVQVTVSDDFKTFAFKPISPLGNPNKDTSYSVALKPAIQKANGSAAFVGAYSAGEAWSFTVSTVIDLTPPRVVSVIPNPPNVLPSGGQVKEVQPRNTVLEIVFNEAMDPIAAQGTYTKGGGSTKNFQHITVSKSPLDEGETDNDAFVNGSFQLSNQYTTVDFVTQDACGKDPCNGTIFCLPGQKTISVDAKAASLDSTNVPQGALSGVEFDGLVDAAGNSLDGNGDNKACGSTADKVACETAAQKNDDYTWSLVTSAKIDDTVPRIESLSPNANEGGIDLSKPLALVFNTTLLASSVNSTNISLWPDPSYNMWFASNKKDENGKSTVFIEHPAFVANADGGSNYWPVVTEGVKSSTQICMFPSMGTDASPAKLCDGKDKFKPYCCEVGSAVVPSETPCKTDQKPVQVLPPAPK